jgi:hypothetical protein
MMPKDYESRELTVLGATSAPRIEMFNGREHLVVPVVALMEGVIHAVNARTPEFVPAARLAAAAHTWNGRPLVVQHPVRYGSQISANDPRVLEQYQCGTIFQSRMTGSKLTMDAWVDPQRLEALGQQALLQRLRAGDAVEVSVGAFTRTLPKTGTFNGRAYQSEWQDTTGDHLALLPDSRGACNTDMGCGVRAAEAYSMAEDEPKAMTRDDDGEWRAAGDTDGHPFHGNQYTDGGGGSGGKLNSEEKTSLRSGGKPVSASVKIGTRVRIDNPEDKTSHQRIATVTAKEKGGIVTVTFGNPTSDTRGRHGSGGFLGPGGRTESLHYSYLRHAAAADGASTETSSLRERVKALLGFRADDDTPGQAASEEAAELIAYRTMRGLLDQLNASWEEASGLVDDLISDEEVNPTVTQQDEEAETEVEHARMDALQVLLGAMNAACWNVQTLVSKCQMPKLPEPSDPRYAEELKAARGARNSAEDRKTIQSSHDAAHTIHDHAMALGADCTGDTMKTLSTQPCGCHKETTTMADEKKARITALMNHDHNPLKDQKALEAASDDALKALEAHCETAATLKAAAATLKAAAEKTDAEKQADEDKAAKDKADALKAASTARTEAEVEADYLKTAPASIRSLVEKTRRADAARKAELVDSLKAAQAAYSEAELKTLELDTLEKLAVLAKVEPAARATDVFTIGATF